MQIIGQCGAFLLQNRRYMAGMNLVQILCAIAFVFHMGGLQAINFTQYLVFQGVSMSLIGIICHKHSYLLQ